VKVSFQIRTRSVGVGVLDIKNLLGFEKVLLTHILFWYMLY
jgi:hypothetical protein